MYADADADMYNIYLLSLDTDTTLLYTALFLSAKVKIPGKKSGAFLPFYPPANSGKIGISDLCVVER